MKLYFGYYVEDGANNPEDPLVGAMIVRLPAADGAFAGQMPFSYVGCTGGADLGAVSGSRSGTSLSGIWAGTVDGVAVGGAYSGTYDAASDSYSGTYANAAGKQLVTVGACGYYVAALGTWRLFGAATSEPAGFTLAVGNSMTPTFSWSSAGAGVGYAVRVFDRDCLLVDVGNVACFRGEAFTTGLSAAFPSAFAGATALSAGVTYVAIATAQTIATGDYVAFASIVFTPTVGTGN